MNGRLPKHYQISRIQWGFSAISIVAAIVLLLVNGRRAVAATPAGAWWPPLAIVAGMAVADFLSGVVHWAADTWGRDDMAVIGRRILVPFRVHHVNPADFLQRGFVDTNGDVAFLTAIILAGALFIPVRSTTGAAATMFLVGCGGVGMMTNQIHQWAHTPAPPPLVRILQATGVILGREAHDRHHAHPYDVSYCITTGWCNAPLHRIDFFRRAERLITALTRVAPRHDDARYDARYRHGETVDA